MPDRPRRPPKRRAVIVASSLAIVLVFLLGSFRSFVIAGASDAPTLLVDDKVIVNRIAYDLFLPFTEIALLSWSDPARGDMVLCKIPGIEDDERSLKRVVGVPGDLVEMRDHRLYINGNELDYLIHDPADFAGVPAVNRLGEVIATERGAGTEHLITYTPGLDSHMASFDPVKVTERHYFLLGDSRDRSMDSRAFGLVPRQSILGRQIATLSRATSD